MANLEFLFLSYNEITTVPKEIVKLQNLKGLYLKGNKIEKLDPIVCQLNINDIDLENNPLSDLPKEMDKMSNLRKLNLTDTNMSKELIGKWMMKLSGNRVKIKY